jgi:hypothetical protein
MNNGSERLDRFERALEHLLKITASQSERMDRHEAAMENILRSQQQLVTAQVVLTDNLGKLVGNMEKFAGGMEQLSHLVERIGEAQQHTDERLNALIQIVDDLVRRTPPPS